MGSMWHLFLLMNFEDLIPYFFSWTAKLRKSPNPIIRIFGVFLFLLGIIGMILLLYFIILAIGWGISLVMAIEEWFSYGGFR